jgi:hypothetical protein
MDAFITKYKRQYSPLPIDTTRGFPQSFPSVFDGQTYHFNLYVNIGADLLDDKMDFLELPGERAYLVARVEREEADGSQKTIFQRKVLPELEYVAENIAIVFPQQRIARNNLNGQGDFGSRVFGGIAIR